MRSRRLTLGTWTAQLCTLLSIVFSGCGGGSSPSVPPPPQPSIRIVPKSALVPIGTNAQFFASVSNASSRAVTWTSSVGSIDQTGYYVAPASVPDGGVATVTATSVSIPSLSASAQVTIGSQPVSITISPPTATVKAGFITVYQAVVDGTSNAAVLWTVNDLPGDDSYPGMISGGNYTAPSPILAPHTYSIEGISSADPSKSATASVTAIPLENQLLETFPIELGTSGFNANTQDCCTGTLGSLLVDDKGKQYLLSNNHVIGRAGHAAVGEAIVQPGMIEAFCDPSIPKTVATFTAAPSLGANVDAAIAEVVPGAVDPAGGIIGLGGVNSDGSYVTSPPSKTMGKFAVGTAVAKSGRTTGLSCGVVEGINGSVNIEYPPECGIPAHQTALFRGQVILNGIARPGDSGSLVVEAATARPLALIFGLSNDGQFVSANPAADVINSLNPVTGSKFSFVGGPDHAVSCSPPAGTVARPAVEDSQPASRGGVPEIAHEDLMRAMAVQSQHENELLQKRAVLAVAIGREADDSSKAALLVFLERGQRRRALPATLDGVPLRIVITKRFGPGTARSTKCGHRSDNLVSKHALTRRREQ